MDPAGVSVAGSQPPVRCVGPIRRAESPIDDGAMLSLLKNQFGAIGRAQRHRAASPILRRSTLIAMMQAAYLREGNNVIACEG
jgi:hypothetical protein